MSIHEQSAAEDEPFVFIEYYTDPLCSWSWAFEAQWRRLRYEYANSLGWRYRMGGLIPDWQSYDDPFNDIRSPAQMGPQWFQVRELSGMPLDERIWREDPPASSYPACVAIKAAERQGQSAAEAYLRRLREAVMLERRNIARQDILLAVAQETARASSGDTPFDFDRFRDDLHAPATIDAFRQDLRDAAYYDIGRFPTLILRHSDGRGIILVGYRPYDALQTALEHLAPDLPRRPALPAEALTIDYVNYWNHVLSRELTEVLGNMGNMGNTEHTATLLETAVAEGLIRGRDVGNEVLIYCPARQESLESQ